MLLVAAINRVVEQHFDWVEELRAQHPGPLDRDAVVTILSTVVEQAVTRHRARYLAMFELFLESTRRPELAEAAAGIASGVLDVVREAHRSDQTPSDLQTVLMGVFYNGAVFSSLALPGVLGQRSPGEVTRAMLDLVLPRGGDGSGLAADDRDDVRHDQHGVD
jgi:AcrR family transcriptional regulator